MKSTEPLRTEPSSSVQGTFAARLHGVVDAHGGASALARVIGRSEGAVRKWLRGESEPHVSDLRLICEATATHVDWLVSGAAEHAPALWTQTDRADPGIAAADYTLLEMLLERIDTELEQLHFKFTARKRAALIVTLFQLFLKTKTIDPDALERAFRLAQS